MLETPETSEGVMSAASPDWVERLPLVTRAVVFIAIAEILSRRAFLAGTIPFPILPSWLLSVLAGLSEGIELLAIMGTPVSIYLWIRVAKAGSIRSPRPWDYALIVLLYLTAVVFVPAPNGHGFFHVGYKGGPKKLQAKERAWAVAQAR